MSAGGGPLGVASILERVGRNTGVMLGVNATGAVVGILMAVALGRALGEDGFGRYLLVMAWLGGLAPLTEIGINTLLVRDLASDPRRTAICLVNSIVAKLAVALPLVAGLVVVAPHLAGTAEVSAALRWGALYLLASPVYSTATSVLRARQDMAPILWLTIGGEVLVLVGTCALLVAGAPLAALFACAAIAKGGQAVAALILVGRRIAGATEEETAPARPALEVIRDLVRGGLPFAVAGVLASVYVQGPRLLLGYLDGDRALGVFGAAGRVINAAKLIPAAFYAAVLPALAALAGGTDPEGRRLLSATVARSRLALLGFGTVAAAGAAVLGRPILRLLFGPEFVDAAWCLGILGATLVPALQSSFITLCLYALGDEARVNLIAAAGIVVVLALCAWWIPLWGAEGAAAAVLVSEIVVFGMLHWRLATRMGR